MLGGQGGGGDREVEQGCRAPQREPGLCWKQPPAECSVLILGVGWGGFPGAGLLTVPGRSAARSRSHPAHPVSRSRAGRRRGPRVRIARPRFPAPGSVARDFLSRAVPGMRRLPAHRRLRVPAPSLQLRAGNRSSSGPFQPRAALSSCGCQCRLFPRYRAHGAVGRASRMGSLASIPGPSHFSLEKGPFQMN